MSEPWINMFSSICPSEVVSLCSSLKIMTLDWFVQSDVSAVMRSISEQNGAILCHLAVWLFCLLQSMCISMLIYIQKHYQLQMVVYYHENKKRGWNKKSKLIRNTKLTVYRGIASTPITYHWPSLWCAVFAIYFIWWMLFYERGYFDIIWYTPNLF